MRKSYLTLLPALAVSACAPTAGPQGMGAMQLTGERLMTVEAATVAPPLLDAGATIRVQIDQPLGPATINSPGTFSASVVEPVLSATGSVLVPAGSLIHGWVVDSEGTLAPPQVLIGLKPQRLEIDGVTFPLESEVIQVELAHAPHGAVSTKPGQAMFGTPESMVPGTIIANAAEFLNENELSPDPGTVISVGTTLDSALPRGTQMVLQVIETAPLFASIPR